MRGEINASLGDVSNSMDEKHILSGNWPEHSPKIVVWGTLHSHALPDGHSTGVWKLDPLTDVLSVSPDFCQHILDSLGPRLLRFPQGAVGHP